MAPVVVMLVAVVVVTVSVEVDTNTVALEQPPSELQFNCHVLSPTGGPVALSERM